MTKKHYKTIFISDIHLWNPKNQWDKLIEFLNSISFDNLVIIWDFIDYRQLNGFWKRWKKEQDTLNYVNNLAKSWINVSYIQWNHDRELKCSSQIHIENMNIMRDMHYITWKWKIYYVTHWDCLDSVNNNHDWIWKFWSKIYGLWLNIEYLRNKNVFETSCISIPEKIDKWIKWRRVPETKIKKKITEFSKNLNCDWIIMWHFHIARHFQINWFDYFNTWDRLKLYSAVAENKEWEVELIFYKK